VEAGALVVAVPAAAPLTPSDASLAGAGSDDSAPLLHANPPRVDLLAALRWLAAWDGKWSTDGGSTGRIRSVMVEGGATVLGTALSLAETGLLGYAEGASKPTVAAGVAPIAGEPHVPAISACDGDRTGSGVRVIVTVAPVLLRGDVRLRGGTPGEGEASGPLGAVPVRLCGSGVAKVGEDVVVHGWV